MFEECLSRGDEVAVLPVDADVLGRAEVGDEGSSLVDEPRDGFPPGHPDLVALVAHVVERLPDPGLPSLQQAVQLGREHVQAVAQSVTVPVGQAVHAREAGCRQAVEVRGLACRPLLYIGEVRQKARLRDRRKVHETTTGGRLVCEQVLVQQLVAPCHDRVAGEWRFAGCQGRSRCSSHEGAAARRVGGDLRESPRVPGQIVIRTSRSRASSRR